MTRTIPIEEANGRLVEIVSKLHPGDQVTLTSKNQTVATIIPKKQRPHRQAHAGKGVLIERSNVADDEKFENYKNYI